MSNRQNRFGFGAPAMGPLAGFGAGYNVNRQPSYAPGAVQVSNLPMPAQYTPDQLMPGQEEDFNALMAQLNAEAGSTSPESPIRAPRDRGMFGRFAGFNPFRFDPDKGVGEGNRLYAIGATLAGMGAGDPALTASLLEPKLKANRERVAARDEEARRQEMLQQLGQMPGVTDQQRALLGMGLGVDQLAERAFAPPQQAEYGLELVRVFNPETGRMEFVQASKAGGVRTVEGYEPVPEAPKTYASQIDALGVRKYTEGPNIGKPVPGFETPRPERGGMQFSVDENGNPVVTFGGPGVGSSFGSRGQAVGANVYSEALKEAATADNTLSLFNTAESILDRGYNSGYFANLRGTAGAIANDVGINIPGFSKPENVADYEEFNTINKQLAAQMLTLFGGSDTERELAISIASNIGPSMSEETNRRMIATGKQLIERQRAKPDHIANWVKRFGSMDAIDPNTGLGYQATWDQILQQLVSNAAGAASERRQSVIEQAVGGPPVGVVRNGYRFKGGNPNDSNNWEPVQ